MIIRRVVAPLSALILIAATADALAQGFPAPLPQQSVSGSSPFPDVNGTAPSTTLGAPSPSPFPSGGTAPIGGAPPRGPAPSAAAGNDCEKGFLPLRDEAEKRGKAIKAASERRARRTRRAS